MPFVAAEKISGQLSQGKFKLASKRNASLAIAFGLLERKWNAFSKSPKTS